MEIVVIICFVKFQLVKNVKGAVFRLQCTAGAVLRSVLQKTLLNTKKVNELVGSNTTFPSSQLLPAVDCCGLQFAVLLGIASLDAKFE